MQGLTSSFSVVIGGQDVSSRWAPILEKLTVNRASGHASDSFEAALSDPGGQTVLPKTGDLVEVSLGFEETGVGWVFSGKVNDVHSSGSKKDGMRLSVSASSTDHESEVKSPAMRHKDNADFAAVAKEWGKKAGLDVSVIGDISSIHRPYWIMQNESYMAWGQRVANDIGATFKIINDRAFFSPRNDGLSVTGQTLSETRAVWGENLEEWNISPILARPKFGEVKGRYYDLFLAKEVPVDLKVFGIDVASKLRFAAHAADEAQAKDQNRSASKESQRNKGGGSVVIIGNYTAEPEAKCVVSGTRPGIDGTYVIDSLSHELSKESGFKTKLTLKMPDGGSGTDDR